MELVAPPSSPGHPSGVSRSDYSFFADPFPVRFVMVGTVFDALQCFAIIVREPIYL